MTPLMPKYNLISKGTTVPTFTLNKLKKNIKMDALTQRS